MFSVGEKRERERERERECVCDTNKSFLFQAVGEPPLLLGTSVYFAIKEAVKAVRQQEGLTQHYPLDRYTLSLSLSLLFSLSLSLFLSLSLSLSISLSHSRSINTRT